MCVIGHTLSRVSPTSCIMFPWICSRFPVTPCRISGTENGRKYVALLSPVFFILLTLPFRLSNSKDGYEPVQWNSSTDTHPPWLRFHLGISRWQLYPHRDTNLPVLVEQLSTHRIVSAGNRFQSQLPIRNLIFNQERTVAQSRQVTHTQSEIGAPSSVEDWSLHIHLSVSLKFKF